MTSPSTGRQYPLKMVCEIYRLARSSFYSQRGSGPSLNRSGGGKRGPRTRWTDSEILAGIRQVLSASSFHSEGHRKIRVRLRQLGIIVGRNRVLRIMRENNLLVPTRRRSNHGDRAHEGRIQTDLPKELWGSDATRFYTREDGWCWFFGAIDHCCQDIVGWHVAKRGDRWAALEPIRQGIRAHYSEYSPKVALGLSLRHDWGPQYTAHQFLGELRWLGIGSTPSYVGEPECNALAERLIQTMNVELLWTRDWK